MPALADKLRGQIEGDLRTDAWNRRLYSVDASLFRIEPEAVLIPKRIEDVQAAMAAAAELGIPVIARGAATGLAGSCLGRGLVIDFSKHLNQVLDIDAEGRVARVQPGVVQDQLNAAVAGHGLRFGPDTSTGNRATLGGMIGLNSSGAHSLRYGKTVDNVLAAELLLAGGHPLSAGHVAASALAAQTGPIWKHLRQVREHLAETIRARFPKLQRRVSGYNLDELLDPAGINLARLIVGSEGTLGVVTEATVRLAPNPGANAVILLAFDDLMLGLDEVPAILAEDPFSLELIDRHIIAAGRRSPVMHGRLDWLEGEPDGVLAVEFDAESAAALADRLDRFEARARRERLAEKVVRLTDPAQIANLWLLRKAGLGLLMGVRTEQRALAFLEDVAVPPDHLGAYAREFVDYMRARERDVGIYGHAGVGLLHFRPMLDLRQRADLDDLQAMMADVSELVRAHGGSMSGEHGDGLVRSWLIERHFGPELYAAFKATKAAFDPDNLLNPGKIVDAPKPDHDLRIEPGLAAVEIDTAFSFAAEGGFRFAIEMCNGNAECRKRDLGLMCPSFHVTGDERDSTRGRATALQQIVQGWAPREALSSRELYEVLEYCLECKGCKTECPSNVDMAKLKSEFLHQYMKVHGKPLRSRLFGGVHRVNRLGCACAPLSNWAMALPGAGFFQGLLGVHPKRRMLPFARQRFTRWLAKHPLRQGDGERVVFAMDTHVEHNFPALGRATVAILQALGCRIEVVDAECCGRPSISKGLLDEAKAIVNRVYGRLDDYAREGWRIVGLEPSYVSVLTEEGRALCPGATADRVAAAASTIDEWLAERRDALRGLASRPEPAAVWVHGHCHQKAGSGTAPVLAVLAAAGLTVHEIDSGCCGMAGSFGYEKEHYEFSLAVGEGRLFPAIRATPADALIVADGVSCRSQIKDGTGRHAQHLVEVLAARLG